MNRIETKSKDVIENGYRLNICIVVTNAKGEALWARRSDFSNAWQFPQGGMKSGESVYDTMFRELKEEVGLTKSDVRVLGETENWYSYKLKTTVDTNGKQYAYIGQKQKWFLLRLLTNEDAIDLSQDGANSEFDAWKWVSYWTPLSEIAKFKRRVYRCAMEALAPYLTIEEG